MNNSPLLFQFPDVKSAKLALDTLHELNYHAHLDRDKKTIQMFVEQSDLTSALEIAQANGGCLTASAQNEGELYNTAYHIDTVPIPAHLINEDWEEDETPGVTDESPYNHFPAGIQF